MVFTELALGLITNLISDTAKVTLGKLYTSSEKAYKNAVKELNEKYRLSEGDIDKFLHQEKVKRAIKEYLINPNNQAIIKSLTDEFLLSHDKDFFFKIRASSILSDFFEILSTEITNNNELVDYLLSYLAKETNIKVQELYGETLEVKELVLDIKKKNEEAKEVSQDTYEAVQKNNKISEKTLEVSHQILKEVKKLKNENKDDKSNHKDTSLVYARNIYIGFSKFKNLALYIDMRCTDDEKNVVLLDNYVEKWLKEGKYPVLAILGDFGTGKTTYVTNLVKRFSSQYIDNNNSYLPVLVRVKDFTKLRTVEDIKAANVTNGLSREDFDKKFDSGEILFVFDGFDELPKDTIGNFNIIYSLTSEKNKVLITSRTHYFKCREEERPYLNPDSIDYTGISLKEEYKVKTVYINLFTEDDIKKYFEKKFIDSWAIKYEMMNKVYNLSDLSKRPILLDLIVQTLSEFSPTTGDITQGKLYDEYINLWMKRESKKHVDPKYVSILMEELAFKMFCENKYVITLEELSDIIDQKFSADIMKGWVNFEDLNEKIRTASFINRDSEDNFTFMHNSFMEFFVAKKLSEEINIGIMDCNNLGKTIITPEIIGFIKELIKNKSNLLNIIEYTRGKTEDETGFLGGNAITLLKCLNSDFRKRDFSSLVLSGADLSNCDLSETCFRKSLMKNVNLSDGILRFADFSEADLNGAKLDTTSKFTCFTWSPNCKYFATTGDDDIVRIWDASTYRQLKIFHSQDSPKCLSWSMDYPLLAIGNSNGSLSIWNVEDGKLYARIHLQHDSISSVALLEDRLISGDLSGHIVNYDLKRIAETQDIVIEETIEIERNGEINKLVPIEQIGYLIVSSGEGLEILNLNNLSTVTLIGKNATPFYVNEKEENVIYTEFDPKVPEMYMREDYLCNLYSREISSLKVDKLHSWVCRYNYDFMFVETDDYYKNTYKNNDELKVIDICGRPHSAEYSLILYCYDYIYNHYLGYESGYVAYRFIMMNEDKVVKEITLDGMDANNIEYERKRNSHPITSLCYSPDGSKIAYIENGEIKIIDADRSKDSFGKTIKVIKRNINCEGIKIHNAKGLNDKQIKFLHENSKRIAKT